MHTTQALRDVKAAVAATHAEALAGFLATVRADADFTLVETYDVLPRVGLWLRDGRNVECLAVARDDLGNWSVFTLDGRVAQYLASEVL